MGIRVIEAMTGRDAGKDADVLPGLLRMLGLDAEEVHCDGKTARSTFVEHLLTREKRFIHVSAHGDKDGVYLHGNRNTPVHIHHIVEHIRTQNVSPKNVLKGCFMTVSACGHPSTDFWEEFHKATGVTAVAMPMGTVLFPDAAYFFASLYFAIGKHRVSQAPTADRLAELIDAFQRAKASFLMAGGCGAFRLLVWWDDELKEII